MRYEDLAGQPGLRPSISRERVRVASEPGDSSSMKDGQDRTGQTQPAGRSKTTLQEIKEESHDVP